MEKSERENGWRKKSGRRREDIEEWETELGLVGRGGVDREKWERELAGREMGVDGRELAGREKGRYRRVGERMGWREKGVDGRELAGGERGSRWRRVRERMAGGRREENG